MNGRFVPARRTARKKKKKEKEKKKKKTSSGFQELSPQQPRVPRAVRTSLQPSQAGQCQARPGRARWLLLGHALSKERTPFSDKQAVGRVPAACFWRGKRCSLEKGWTQALGRFNPSRAGWFCRVSRGSGCTQCTKTHQWQILSSTSWQSSLLQVFGIKSPYATPSEQTDINLLICSVVPNQRHDSHCTVPRYFNTYRISHGGVAVSVTQCCCVPHTAQQCCSALLIPKNMHHLAKKKARIACVMLPVCFSSAAKCSWSSVLNFKSVSPAPPPPFYLFVRCVRACFGFLTSFIHPQTSHLLHHRPAQRVVHHRLKGTFLSLPQRWHYKMLS